MATIRVLRDCVVAHQRRIAGELVEMDEYTARRLADEQPETFEWVDRPVKQFVDVQPVAPVGEDAAQTRLKTAARRPPPLKLKQVDGASGAAVEVDDGDESAG